jgi:MFS family permease
VAGDTLGGVASDRILRATGNLVVARRSVIIVGFLGACAFLIPVVLIHDLTVSAVCLSLAFFFAELIVAPIWAVPMDIAPLHAGSASGLMNFGSAFAGIISPFFFGFMIDVTGTWTVPFVASIVLLLLGAILAFSLRPDLPFIEADLAEGGVLLTTA